MGAAAGTTTSLAPSFVPGFRDEVAATELAAAFDAPRERVGADVLTVAERLGGYRLLEGIDAEVADAGDGATDA